jgi:hypothetical protein
MTDPIDHARQPGASDTTSWNAAAPDVQTVPFLAHPQDVVDDPARTVEQKRLILASWLSDRHAVPDAPRWRELENGAFVDVQEIERALRILDDIEAAGRSGERGSSSSVARRKWRKQRLGAILRRNRNNDDDDPPPSPVAVEAPVPPRDWDFGAMAELTVAA